jgi:hypothetical protein
MNVGEGLRMFHRNTGQPVYDSRGEPITLPAGGAGMTATVTEVIGPTVVNLTAVDAAGKEFHEERRYQ